MVSATPAVLVFGAAVGVSLATALLPSTAVAQTSYPTDDRGFVASSVRCDAPQSAVSFGRTAQSLVAICLAPDGHYEYRGARLGDDAVLVVVAEPTVPGEFFAQKDGATYTVTAKQLVIKTDEWVRAEPMLDFQTPPMVPVPPQ
ncbi:hypothetical protein [Mycolicibacterium holsaticum]|jgi:hypothetical protein|uniref:Serine/threonine protein kinase n=1 Tax=Mycolicibacterium holsaticum TaxID=152142 RepID=A0A1E3RQL2_9MYCO|nr:hypothetical protein [Mycolicibacterium holsaticum]MDA4109078.1 hypothetical protein [Mycolicibacterium holsaticum DSM 44478 = JCM 12374]ODQ92140.1 hypothetical protein BHQ17_16535 [Mycolicibacterium holsaticum]QZA11490.1 hypothetical protein K3U96_20100 [Mycolicibacterium holsaticum DSM 44478 = JCM 12374]UNC11021.1 hypothetical protein H5U41_06730 [Mycolicibacterium holsaticum DSM 44478 = JCM 12374]